MATGVAFSLGNSLMCPTPPEFPICVQADVDEVREIVIVAHIFYQSRAVVDIPWGTPDQSGSFRKRSRRIRRRGSRPPSLCKQSILRAIASLSSTPTSPGEIPYMLGTREAHC
jgi:hypothetical protein